MKKRIIYSSLSLVFGVFNSYVYIFWVTNSFSESSSNIEYALTHYLPLLVAPVMNFVGMYMTAKYGKIRWAVIGIVFTIISYGYIIFFTSVLPAYPFVGWQHGIPY